MISSRTVVPYIYSYKYYWFRQFYGSVHILILQDGGSVRVYLYILPRTAVCDSRSRSFGRYTQSRVFFNAVWETLWPPFWIYRLCIAWNFDKLAAAEGILRVSRSALK